MIPTNNVCTRCPAGQHAASGATACTACTGATAPNEDQSSCISCTGETPYLSSDKTTCTGRCTPGEGPGNDNICVACKAGTASNIGLQCVECTGKQYSDVDGAT